jgi:signal transduction histidine kinase/DNA-binding response OmpR family regulator
MRRMWETITDGRVWKGEFQNRAKDGGLYWVDATIVPYLDHKGTPVQYISIRTDVTECKRVESALQKKNVELEEASRMKSEFLANMSHELRTPLNAIIGFSEVLKDGLLGELSERQRKFVGDIFGSGTHLLSLINDILDLSKVEAGKMTLDLELVPVHALLSNGLSIVREKAAARGIHVDMAASDDLVSIHADPRKLTQIVYNLLSNAVKFSPDGGHVTLRARVVSRGAVGQPSCAWPGRSLSLANSPFTEFLEVRVTDDGIGMPQEALAQLFRPFTQIDSGLSREFEGTGLGLAMVKLLAELHGGAVAVESAVGQGSCFTVWLPARTSDAEAPMRVSAGAISRARGRFGVRTALVVEDDAKAADLIRMQLEAEGFTVVHAATAETAVVLAGQQPLSLITLDMLLPTMDGWELLGRFKQVPDLARVPVVIMSIVADSDRGFALGAAAVLQKPVARQDFYHALVDLGLLPVAEGRALRVLICDDDAKALELYAFSILGLAGSIIRAHGGQEAIALAQQELPDVIVLDLVMPDVGGLDVVAALQLRPDTARIPVLVVTAQGITAEDRARLRGYRTTIMGQSEFNADRFAAEVSGASSARDVVV